MKNIGYFFAVLFFAAVACSKEAPIEVVEDSVPGAQEMIFTAIADNSVETRTILNDHDVEWAPGEGIYVFDGQAPRAFTSTNAQQAAIVTFQGTAAVTNTYYAISPYGMFNGSTFTATIPVFQTPTAGSFDPKANVSVAVSGSDPNDPTQLQFKNIGSVVKFALTDNDVVKVRLDAIGGEDLSGKVSVQVGQDGIPTASIVSGAGESCVIMDNGTNALSAGTAYYFCIAPGTYSGGFRLTLMKADGKYKSFSNKNSQTLTRSGMMDFGTIPAVTSWKEGHVELFNESFTKFDSKGGNDGDYSGGSGSFSANQCDESGWTFSGNVYAAKNCVRVGKNSGTTFTTRALDLSESSVLTFRAALFGSDGTTLSISVDHGTVSPSSVTMVQGEWNEYSVTITGGTNATKITFSPSKRCFLDDIVVARGSSSLPEDPTVDEASLSINDITPSDGKIGLSGGTASFVINSNAPWTISSSDESINYSIAADGKTVNVVFGSISTGSRTVVFTVASADGLSEQVSFTQSADPTTYSMSISSSQKPENSTCDVVWYNNVSATLSHNDINWSATVTGTTTFVGANAWCAIGSKNNPATKITLSTTDFAGKTIVAARLKGYCTNTEGPKLNIKAGNTMMLTNKALVKTTPTVYETTVGNVVLSEGEDLIFEITSSVQAGIVIFNVEVDYL